MELQTVFEVAGVNGGWVVRALRESEDGMWEPDESVCLSIKEVLRHCRRDLQAVQETDSLSVEKAMRGKSGISKGEKSPPDSPTEQ